MEAQVNDVWIPSTNETTHTLHAPIKKLRDINDDMWPEARGEIEIFKFGDDNPLDEIMNPPFAIDFLRGPSLQMLLTLSEQQGYWELIENFIKPMQGQRLRFHYALTREINQEDPDIPITDKPALITEKRTVLDLSFSGILRSWGFRRFSQRQRQSYNLLFTNLKENQTPPFKRPA
jgi:hypothetical protein